MQSTAPCRQARPSCSPTPRPNRARCDERATCAQCTSEHVPSLCWTESPVSSARSMLRRRACRSRRSTQQVTHVPRRDITDRNEPASRTRRTDPRARRMHLRRRTRVTAYRERRRTSRRSELASRTSRTNGLDRADTPFATFSSFNASCTAETSDDDACADRGELDRESPVRADLAHDRPASRSGEPSRWTSRLTRAQPTLELSIPCTRRRSMRIASPL